MHAREKIVGMDMHVGRNITMRNMLRKEIMFVVQPGGLIHRSRVMVNPNSLAKSCIYYYAVGLTSTFLHFMFLLSSFGSILYVYLVMCVPGNRLVYQLDV